jgi:exopolyphosphatase/guanosine-5'-triphosphate,3'-diphosphate pyrophosphatase
VLGTGSVEGAVSVDVGCVRLTERRLRSDPPTRDEIEAACADIGTALDLVTFDVASARTFVGLAGSVTTVTALALGLPRYDPDAIHLSRVSFEEVRDVTERLLRATRAERAAMQPMHPGRVDVIGAGALVLRELMARWSIDAVVASERDILDGIALSIA